MTLAINIPDAIAPSVVDNICAATAWNTTLGITKPAWAKKQIADYIRRLNAQGASKIAAIAAGKNAANAEKAQPITLT